MAPARPFWLPFTAGAAFSYVVFFLLSAFDRPRQQALSSVSTEPQREREQTQFQAATPNFWSELSRHEVTELYDFLYTQPDLNLTKSPSGYGTENYVTEVEVLRPNKSRAVAFLDDGAELPDRYARVSMVESSGDEAFICEYKVGPLPPSEKTEVVPLRYPHAAHRHCIQTPITDVWGFFAWALSIGYDVQDITQDLLGGEVNLLDPFDPDSLWVGARPAVVENGQMVHWLEFFRNGPRSDGHSLLPQGLYTKLNVSSPDPKTWKYTEWRYNGITYPDLDTFRDAWRSPNFTKSSLNQDGAWTDTEDFTSRPLGRSQPPPLSIQPFGPRYELDKKAAYVSWMGFTFYLSTSASRALSLHDIRFNNTRLIYELGLQEALAHYAGSEPMQSGLEFLDTFFGMGNMMFPLVPGHDCPAYADYLDMTYHKNGQMFVNKNAICVFEYTSDAPLQRHTAEFAVTVSRNSYLVVRSVSTVGNYDYTIDYLFYLDGSIEIKVRASGYIFAAYAGGTETPSSPVDSANDELRPRSEANPNNQYGYKIQPAASTSMHDHVLLFRADIDLPNPSTNTFQTISVEPITHSYPWDSPEAPTRNTMHLVKQHLTHETGLNWPRNSKAIYLISSNETNTWGEPRSYRIQPGTGMGTPSHLTILNSTSLGKSALWADHDLWVLKQHDAEPLAAHEKNYLDPNAPLVDFSFLADGEEFSSSSSSSSSNNSVADVAANVNSDADASAHAHAHANANANDRPNRREEESQKEQGDDLVVLFNLGGHHVPHSGDIPNTLMHTSASSVVLSPFNFFDDDVSKRARQGVRVDGRANPGPNGWEKGVRWFGGRYGATTTETRRTGRRNGHAPETEDEIRLRVSVDLEPSLERYFEEDGPGHGHGHTVGNQVGGGLLGLFGSREEIRARLEAMRDRFEGRG